MSYLDAIKLAPHYHALNMTEIMLEEEDVTAYPWHLVDNYVNPPFFYDRSTATRDLEFVALDPGSGLMFTWLYDVDFEDGTVDLKSCQYVLSQLPPMAKDQFKEHLKKTVRTIHEFGTVLIDDGKKEQADALILSQLVQP
jgi:hypothetical protein